MKQAIVLFFFISFLACSDAINYEISNFEIISTSNHSLDTCESRSLNDKVYNYYPILYLGPERNKIRVLDTRKYNEQSKINNDYPEYNIKWILESYVKNPPLEDNIKFMWLDTNSSMTKTIRKNHIDKSFVDSFCLTDSKFFAIKNVSKSLIYIGNNGVLNCELQSKNEDGEWNNLEVYISNHLNCVGNYKDILFPNEIAISRLIEYKGEVPKNTRLKIGSFFITDVM